MNKILTTFLLLSTMLIGFTSCDETEEQLDARAVLTSGTWYSEFGDYEFYNDNTVELFVENDVYRGTWRFETLDAGDLYIQWNRLNGGIINEFERWVDTRYNRVLISARIESSMPEVDGQLIELYPSEDLLRR